MSENYDMMNTPEAAALLKDADRLKALLKAPETLRLMKLLSARNGDSLKQAAERARKGDVSSLSSMMEGLTSTGEGAELVEKLQKTYRSR